MENIKTIFLIKKMRGRVNNNLPVNAMALVAAAAAALGEQWPESACGSSQGAVAFIKASLTEGGLHYPLRGQWRETLKAV